MTVWCGRNFQARLRLQALIFPLRIGLILSPLCTPPNRLRLLLPSQFLFDPCRWDRKHITKNLCLSPELFSLLLNPMFKGISFVLQAIPAIGMNPQSKERRR
jgi:hypothetical protein